MRPHTIFERRSDDVIVEIPVSFVQAALGDVVEVPTLEGTQKLHIPHGTQAGAHFNLQGKGLPRIGGGGRGDQHVIVHVQTPTDLTDEQKRLLAELAKASGIDITPDDGRGFFDKLLGK